MKTSYELAMERFKQSAPVAKLSTAQKKDLAEIESRYKARLAEREIFLQGEIGKAVAKGDIESVEQFEKQLASDRKSLHAEMEDKKEAVWLAK